MGFVRQFAKILIEYYEYGLTGPVPALVSFSLFAGLTSFFLFVLYVAYKII